jgi:hypothetical protein
MQAPGHEEIERQMSDFLKQLVGFTGFFMGNPSCRSINNNFYNDSKHDMINRSMYLGNWLTDNSQIFAPDFFFDFQYNLPEYVQGIENILATTKEKANEILNSSELNYILSTEIKTDLTNWINKVLGTSVTYAGELKLKATNAKPNPEKFEYDSRDQWWMFALSILKLKGFNKFCRAKSNRMSEDLFIKIVNSFIDEKKGDKTYQFKLNQYYPNDHLDRAFDTQWIKDEGNKQIYANQWRKSQQIDNIADKEYKAKQFEEYENRGSLRRNCYDDKNVENNCYKYLQDYIKILGQKLNFLNAYFVKPYILEGKQISKDDFLILCAKLGHSLHGVEDFFAHSNYIELIVNNIDRLNPQMDNPEKYFSQDAFKKNLSSYEKERYTRAVPAAVRDFSQEKAIKTEEINLTTGIFAEVDTLTSMYHLTFDVLEDKIDEWIDGSNLTDDPFIEMIQFFMESLADYIALYDSLAAEWKVEKKFNIKIIRFILNKNTDPEVQKNNPALINAIDDKMLEYWVNVLNSLMEVATVMKIASGNIKLVLKFIQIILMTIFLPLVIISFIKRVLSALLLKKIIDPIAKMGLHYIKNKIANWIENDKLKLDSAKMYGTHSVLAKDEKFRNENWNYQAKRMAKFMDKFILVNMFIGTDTKNNMQINMEALLKKYLAHPCPDNSKKPAEIKNELELYGNTTYVTVIDSGTKKLTTCFLNTIYRIGIINRIKRATATDYKKRFLELNGEYIKEVNLDDLSFRISEIKVKDYKSFSVILIPFQEVEEYYASFNNKLVRSILLRNVAVTGQTDITKNKMWMMQFFNIKDYGIFQQYTAMETLMNSFKNKKPEENIDELFLEKDRILFGEDKVCISTIDNTNKINCDEVEKVFGTENSMKNHYELFVEAFIKLHYRQ